jgi:hypothetical protein
MSYRKALFVLSFVGLVLWTVQDASGWGTGGSIKSPRKLGFADLQLYCDLSHPSSTATIDTTPSNLDPTVRPSFKFSGKVVCAEVAALDLTPTLADAINFTSGGKAIGIFDLIQVTDPALFPGLEYTGPSTAVDGVRTWTFDVTGHDSSFPFAQALWKLVPFDAAANKFCDPAELGVTGVPPILNPDNCQALFGLQFPLNASDYGGTPGLNSGEVFTFSTRTENGVERPLGFTWAPCHTTRFIGPKTPDVFALANNAEISPSGGGGVIGTPAIVANPSTDTGLRNTLEVTVQPNDLWNAGPIPRWSNAAGLTQDFFTDASHNSYKTVDLLSGMTYLDQLDPQVAAFCSAQPAECPMATIPNKIGESFPNTAGDNFLAPFGALVGKVETTYHLLGTHATVPVPEGTELKLFYWDWVQPIDNTGSVNVTVSTDSIQCMDNSTPIAAQGDVRGNTVVDVVYNPTLNVDNKSKTANYPTTIVGCADYGPPFVIQSNGSPIINGTASNTQVFVAGTEVTLTGFHVADTVSRPSCENGHPLPDLKLDLNRLSLINAVAPGGKCTNGINSFKLEIGSETNGWFAGTSTMTLSHCN